jgi:ubiquinol-cytochrome c reductase cytochrome c1 subunit
MNSSLRNRISFLTLCTALLLPAAGLPAGGAGALEPAGVNIKDIAASQRGARLFMNYCMSCHSANYMRYNRLVEDLGLSEQLVLDNLVFADKKIGDTMSIAMQPDDGARWFGKTPPDLSLVGRSRGSDWLYAYLRGFYRDEHGAWNNTALPNAAMPHVMWPLQGIQEPVYQHHMDHGVEVRTIEKLKLAEPGSLSAEEYDSAVRDLVTFLEYLGEPAKMKRKNIGVWVMLYLVVFALLAWLLKAEYWRDVH